MCKFLRCTSFRVIWGHLTKHLREFRAFSCCCCNFCILPARHRSRMPGINQPNIVGNSTSCVRGNLATTAAIYPHPPCLDKGAAARIWSQHGCTPILFLPLLYAIFPRNDFNCAKPFGSLSRPTKLPKTTLSKGALQATTNRITHV